MTFETTSQIVGIFTPAAAVTPPPAAAAGTPPAAGKRFESQPAWGNHSRSWDAAETHRLNRAHWQTSKDVDINCWLRAQLAELRARATTETRNNGMLAGVANTLVDDVIGPDGPMLEVQSDDPAYNSALEQLWREWFKAPTFRPNVSGASMLRLWVRNLPRCGEFLSVIGTDTNADGPVQMRLRPLHPRRLASPYQKAGNPREVLGVEFDRYDRPTRYWITETDAQGYATEYVPYAPDDVIHEFTFDEEGQARGYPWLAPSLQPAADLRDYDDDVQHASRRNARANGMLYTESPDAPVWTAPESYCEEPGIMASAPPQWKPYFAPPGQPAAQYSDYRAERQRELGRPMNMPLLMVRLDASKHSYSSARLDNQSWSRTVEGIQNWLSGTPESAGTLNRLVDLVAAEGRFTVRPLRRRPAAVRYLWTWPARPHVDVTKEADAETIALETGTLDLITALAGRGTTIERHLASIQRARAAYEAANVPLPAWMDGTAAAATPEARADRQKADLPADQKPQASEKANA